METNNDTTNDASTIKEKKAVNATEAGGANDVHRFHRSYEDIHSEVEALRAIHQLDVTETDYLDSTETEYSHEDPYSTTTKVASPCAPYSPNKTLTDAIKVLHLMDEGESRLIAFISNDRDRAHNDKIRSFSTPTSPTHKKTNWLERNHLNFHHHENNPTTATTKTATNSSILKRAKLEKIDNNRKVKDIEKRKQHQQRDHDNNPDKKNQKPRHHHHFKDNIDFIIKPQQQENDESTDRSYSLLDPIELERTAVIIRNRQEHERQTIHNYHQIFNRSLPANLDYASSVMMKDSPSDGDVILRGFPNNNDKKSLQKKVEGERRMKQQEAISKISEKEISELFDDADDEMVYSFFTEH